MLRRLLCYLTLVALISGAAFAKKKKTLPKLVVNAKYVYITTYEGPDQTSPQLPPGDVQAVNDVREALRKWGYYTETIQRNQADLILRVRKGGSTAKMGGNLGGNSGPDRGIGPASVGSGGDAMADLGPPEDILEVYDAKLGTNTAPLWRGMAIGGLDPPRMQLLADFQSAVKEAANLP
ncbi:MAG TPA: hypothetical protein VKW78_19735 [Terriglobales bacterium]|nr:hypothetical protein [Terriglobales bacterium]